MVHARYRNCVLCTESLTANQVLGVLETYGRTDLKRAFLDDRRGRHEMPQWLEFTTSLPRTPVGKYSRKMLRDQVLKALDGA